jgi:hypothetical protein
MGEWYRHLAEAGLPPSKQMPRSLWTWEVRAEVADLASEERLDRVGLEPPVPGRRTWLAYQQIGEALFRQGWAGLIAQAPHGATVVSSVSSGQRARSRGRGLSVAHASCGTRPHRRPA